MILWCLWACAPRVTLATLADEGVALSVVRSKDDPVDGALRVDAAAVDFRVRGTGADRDSNAWFDLGPGVRLQCEVRQRVVAISAFIDAAAVPGKMAGSCPVGGVNIPVEVVVP